MSVKPAHRYTRLGGKFGSRPPGPEVVNHPGQAGRALSLGYLGLVGGITGGAIGHAGTHRKERKKLRLETDTNSKKQAANTRKIRAETERLAFGKRETVHQITDVGTRAEKYGYDAYSMPRPTKYRVLSRNTRLIGAGALAGGVALGVSSGRAEIKGTKKRNAGQRSRIKRQEEKMERLGIAKSAFDVEHSVSKSVMNPSSVAQGKRKRNTKKGKYKHKPKVGRGEYHKAPLMRDKVTKPRWIANALVNNPGTGAAVGAVGGAAAIQAGKKYLPEEHQKKADVASGALLGGAAGHGARLVADYGTKEVADRQIKTILKPGARNYGPYAEGPHKAVMNRYKRTAKGDARAKAKMFDENFPKGVPSHNARKVGVFLNKKPTKAGVVLTGAAIGAVAGGHKKKVKKNMGNISAFGVDHADEIAKKKKPGEPEYSTGRAVAATTLSPYHGLVAGKKGKKLRSAGKSIAYGVGGSAAGSVGAGGLAALATRGRSPGAVLGGSYAGGLGGAYYGTNRAFHASNRKGYYKKQSKDDL